MQMMASHSLTTLPLSLPSPCHPQNQKQPQNLSTKPSPIPHSPSSTPHYNSLIRAHINSQQPTQALSLFRRLLLSDPPLLPDNFTFPLALKACARLSALRQAQQIHSLILKSHSVPGTDVFIQTSLVSAYGECGCIDDARLVFDRMPQRNVVTWNSIMAGFLKCGDLSSAVECFHQMPERNVVSWNSLMGGYVRASMPHEAVALFLDLGMSGLKPDESTVVSFVSAVSDLGLLDLGRKAHGYVARNEFSLDGALGVALIAMYARCGSIGAAHKVFLGIPAKNVGHWSSMIAGFANHGLTEASLRLFSEMLQAGIRPNHITFIGVLNACRHAGLAEEGVKYFNLMRSFDIQPRIEHYGCLIDLVGRSGLVEEAMEIAYKLPMDPGFVVWGTLLAACVNHGNVEMAEVVVKRLIELRPEHGSAYVQLSNLYANVGRPEDFRRMRKVMEERRAVKVAGISRIEVDGRFHEFVAGDQLHAKAEEIYSVLEDMKLNLRCEGCESVVCGVSGRKVESNEEEDLRLTIDYPIA